MKLDIELEQFIKSHIDLINEDTEESWRSIYRDFEDYDSEDLPGNFGRVMLECGIDPCIRIGEVPRRFLQYQNNITSYKIPDNCTYIGMSAFEDTSIKSIDIPDSVNAIDFLAFSNTRLKSITLPDKVRILENAVFFGCKELEEVDLGNVFIMGQDIFEGCEKLSKIIIPNTIEILDSSNFNGCTNLKEIVFLGTKDQFSKIIVGYPDNNKIAIHCTDGDYIWEADW